jgi:hypothetical protein
MTDAILNQSAIAKMQEGSDYLRLRDAGGRVVGFFVPADPAAAQIIYGAKSPLTSEERERRSQDTAGSKPLAEFWADMREQHPEKF